ncbi:N-acylneuraminate-9-phosphatase-like [Acanthaster planci]|uniref:N-acylneuraminate-9-phosphatase-like n=1 Tax=Acanthaster planci TaxID=133434 RepID=A0A8B7YE53_ACAPL|nr:N-acylneuraminate-9-phosphatase-like [Acanthaster planci]
MAAAGKVSAIIFDLDNTLIDTRNADFFAFKQVKAVLRSQFAEVDADDVVAAFRKYLAEAEKDPNEVIPVDEWRTELWQRALNSHHPKDAAVLLYRTWMSGRLDHMTFSEEVKGLLRRLRQRYKLLLMTNGPSAIQRLKMARCGADEYFNGIIVSGEQPHPKPDVSIFRTAFEMLDVPAEHCIMVGDCLSTDIQGGLDAGCLATVWIDPKEQNKEIFFPSPNYSIASVMEIDKVLDDINTSVAAGTSQ